MEPDTDKTVYEAFRRWGYLEANLDPLGRLAPQKQPELEVEGMEAQLARQCYCGSVGVEFMHIPHLHRRRWVAERMEGRIHEPEPMRILDSLIRAETFEQVLQTRYIGTKRYSLEGASGLLPLLQEVLSGMPALGGREVVLAMSHRGRLNVMVNLMGVAPEKLFAHFEDVDPRRTLGGGDVRYHLGATGRFEAGNGDEVFLHLVSNPSHLEAVTPVALGRAYALQRRRIPPGRRGVLPLLIHGDAAFAGQGILAETLNLAGLDGYAVGGTIHVVVNNLIGFTTEFHRLHGSRFATDVAKRLPIPIFHVNGEDMDAVIRAARLALEYRYAFSSDVIVDLVCYRRHGHSEVDDPTVTQPLLYARIREHPPLWRLYARRLGVPEEACEKIRLGYRETLDVAQEEGKASAVRPPLYVMPDHWKPYFGGPYDEAYEVETGVAPESLRHVTERVTAIPLAFHIHGKVAELQKRRLEMGTGERLVDFGMAETLAFGTLLSSGVPVRLSGQDTRRGTFNHRHGVWVDMETGADYTPLAHIDPSQAAFEVIDSPLSEAAALGFEYGVSRDAPGALVLWEAQFGDFANGAQVIIDQFIAAGEDKWNLLSGLVLLLPHAYEGQGPEHSSARIERFLQVAAEGNLQVCQPTTAAQYFHLLRRQALRRWRKPLVILAPKSYLRHAAAASALSEFSAPRFRRILPDPQAESPSRILLCTGKVVHELRRARAERGLKSVAILALEELYPFPEKELAAEIGRRGSAREIVWVQEEPANMGALSYVLPWLGRLARGRAVRSVKRSASASPATGSPAAHAMEQKALLSMALGPGAPGGENAPPAGRP